MLHVGTLIGCSHNCSTLQPHISMKHRQRASEVVENANAIPCVNRRSQPVDPGEMDPRVGDPQHFSTGSLRSHLFPNELLEDSLLNRFMSMTWTSPWCSGPARLVASGGASTWSPFILWSYGVHEGAERPNLEKILTLILRLTKREISSSLIVLRSKFQKTA